MIFNSFAFLLFLAIVYTVWRALPFNAAKRFLCFASLFFYSYWFPPYVFLLLTTGFIDYWAAFLIQKKKHGRKRWLIISITSNLSILCLFKYFNFFQQTLGIATSLTGAHFSPWFVDVILPIGISFYTFESMSYIIDVYRGFLEPCHSMADYVLYIAFFPHLVAGPIIRASDFLPQLAARNRVVFDDFRFALYRILRGFFLKVVIADNVAQLANTAFSSHGPALREISWFGALAFAIQIFCDFSGYSDIAIGTAKLFGLNIVENFRNPYLARGVGDFWSRWHMSLTTWFRDYLYIPLGGNRVSSRKTYRNLCLVFLLSGLWHGANWTFVLWGALHGTALAIERFWIQNSRYREYFRKSFFQPLGLVATWIFLLFVWVPFRAPSVSYTFEYWKAMLTPSWSQSLTFSSASVFVLFFILYQTIQAVKVYKKIGTSRALQLGESLAYLCFTLTLPGPAVDFIYFQF